MEFSFYSSDFLMSLSRISFRIFTECMGKKMQLIFRTELYAFYPTSNEGFWLGIVSEAPRAFLLVGRGL